MPFTTYTKSGSNLRFMPAVEAKLDPGRTKAGLIGGYASTYGGQPDAYGDVIAEGAFARTLAEHEKLGSMPVMLWSHDMATPIGRWTQVRSDKFGLYVEGELNLETERGRDAHSHLRKGDVSGLSIGFRVPKEGRTYAADGSALLTDIDLVEISVVAVPANAKARVNAVKHIASKRELESLLRDQGVPKAAAVKLAAGGWPALGSDDEEGAIELAARMVRFAERMRTDK